MNPVEFTNKIGAKLNAAQPYFRKSGIRNDRGVMWTTSRIMESSKNLYFSLGGDVHEPVNAIFKNFSDAPGLNDVRNVEGVDVVDINIQATLKSVMSYLTVERPMSKPTDTAWYQSLVAVNNAGGFKKGDKVFNPFSPISSKLNLGRFLKDAELSGSTGKFNGPIAKGTVVVTVGVGDEAVHGTDVKGDGKLLWDGANTCTAATIDYETGTVTVTGVTPTKITASPARTSEYDGASTLKVKPQTDNIMIKSQPNRIILENSFEDTAYINKQAYDQAAAGVSLDFGKRAINQLLKLFVSYLDFTSVTSTADVMFKRDAAVTLDLTEFSLMNSEASTKNDIINQKMLQLNKALLTACGKGANAILVDPEGATIIANNPMYFQGNPSLNDDLDGMIGTYNGIPVIRHHVLTDYVDAMLGSDGAVHGFIGMLYKAPDGSVAPTIYGEYLAPYSITPALNFNNPAQYSQALLSQSVTTELVDNLCVYMDVVVSRAGESSN